MKDPIHSNPPPQFIDANVTGSGSSPERKTLRVFVSSPDDLGEERALVQDLVRRLAVEYQRHFRLTAVIWEETALSAAQDFQEGIIEPANCDIVVVMLWSKLGSIIKAPGYEGMTGTEWEFHNAIRRAEINGVPAVLMYRKTAPKAGNLMDQAVVDQAREDSLQLDAFFEAEVLGKKRAYRVFDNKDRLAQMLEQHLRSELNKHRVSESVGYWEGSPFRGLKSFEYEHRGIYFGRDQAKRQLLHQLAQQVDAGVAFIMVSAMSGSGKSSLVKAGLLPMLESFKAIGDVVLAPWTVMRPNDAADEPVTELASAILRPKGMAAAAIDDAIGIDWVTEALRNSPALLKPFLQSALDSMAEGGEARLVLVVDQFEELFSNKHFTQQAREQFIAALDALARSGLVWVIATMRSDFLHQVEAFPVLVALMSGDGQFQLARPREDELLQMIREPARIAGLKFEQGTSHGLDQRLMEDAAKDMGSLPLLEFTLDALYERRDGETFTFAAYQAIGGIEGAVADRAERVFVELSAAAQGSFEYVFRMLVTVDPDSRGVSSRRALRRQLLDAPGAAQLVEAFVEGHLLVSGAGQDDEVVVWVAHEALLRAWPRLRDWVENNIADLRARSHLLERASQWEREGRNNDFLLTEGRPFVEAADLVKRFGSQLDPLERLFVQRSEQHIRATRWRLFGLLGFLGALLGLIVLATFAFSNANRNFQAGNLEKASSDLYRGNVARAVFLAVNSEVLPDSATEVLSRAFSREYLRAMVNQLDEGDPSNGLAENGYRAGFSSDGHWVISLPDTGPASLWELQQQPPRYNGPYPVGVGGDAGGDASGDATGDGGRDDNRVVSALFAAQDTRLALLSNHCLRLLSSERLATAVARDEPVLANAQGCNSGTEAASGELGTVQYLNLGAGQIATDLDGIRLARWDADGRQLAMVRRIDGGDRPGWELLVVSTAGERIGSRHYSLPGGVRSLELSPDGGLVAVATRGGHLCLVATADQITANHASEKQAGSAAGDINCQLITKKRAVNKLAFDPAGKRLVAVSADQMLRLFSVAKAVPECIGVLGSEDPSKPGGKGSWVKPGTGIDCSRLSMSNPVHDGSIRAVAFSPDGNSLATGGDDRRVVIWRIGDGKVRWNILGRHDQIVTGAVFAPADLPNRLVTTSIDHTARLWNTANGEQVMEFGHDGPVLQARFVADRPAPASDQNSDQSSDPSGQQTGSAAAVSYGLMTVAADRTARLWQIEPINPIAYPLVGHQNHVWYVAFRPLPADAHAATGSEEDAAEQLQMVTTAFDGKARLWTLNIDRPLAGSDGFRYLRERVRTAAVTEFPAGVLDDGGPDPVRYAAFANRSEQLVTTTKQGRIDIWSLHGERRCSMRVGGLGSPSALLPMAGFSADDQRLFSAQTGKGAQVWTLSACGQQQALRCEAPACQSFALSGKVTAAISTPARGEQPWRPVVGFADGRIAVLDPDRPDQPVCVSAQAHTGPVVDIRYSPSHDALLTASADGTAALWDPQSCRRQLIYSGDDSNPGHEQSLYSARFSPDGKRIVTASQDRTAIIWRRDGHLLHRLVGHLDRVYHASFSPDGRWVLTASRDGSSRLWDSADDGGTLATVVKLEGNHDGVSSAAFSPDGHYVASGYWKPGADLWDVLNGDLQSGLSLTMPDYARRFAELNRLQQWRVKSVPRELPWWQEISRAVWDEAQ